MTVNPKAHAKNFKLVGTLTTVSPVAIALPNITGMPINSHGAVYIPASSIRGFLRSVAHHATVLELEKIGKVLSVDQHYMNAAGVDTGRVLKLGGGYEAVNKNLPIREKNPLISLFGNFVLGSHVQVGNAFASPNQKPIVTLGNGARNHPFARNRQLIGCVKEEELEYLQAVMNATAETADQTDDIKDQIKRLKAEVKKADADRKPALYSQIDELESNLRAVKESRTGSAESILRPLDGFEAIDAGYDLANRIQVTDSTNYEFDFFLWVLYKASYDFRLGGHANLGCGQIHAQWEVSSSSLDNPKPTLLGKVLIGDNGFESVAINNDPKNPLNFDPAKVEEKIRSGFYDFTVY